MATVSSLVVRRRLASMRQVEDALARQTLYGGDVVTNLLEVAPPPLTDEAALVDALAEALALPPAPLASLREPDPSAVATVPKETAERHGFVPIARRGERIVVAVAEALSTASIAAVHAEIGVAIEPCAAPVVRLRQALERAYGVPMDRRSRRLSALLDGVGRAPSVPPPRRTSIPEVSDDPRRPPPLPSGLAPLVEPPRSTPAPLSADPAPEEPKASERPSRPPPPTTIRKGLPGADALKWFVKGARRTTPVPRERARTSSPSGPSGSSSWEGDRPSFRRRRGPFTREEVDRLFADPPSTDAVLAGLVEFAAQWFAYVALFLVQEDLAEGWEAHGVGAPGERVRKMGVPLDLPSLFATAREGRTALVRARPDDGLDVVIATDLERPPGGDVVVAPIVVGRRVVALLYGDDAGAPIAPSEIGEVLAVIAAAGPALARIIVRRKGGRLSAPGPKVRKSDPRSPALRAEILARAIGATSSRPPKAGPAEDALAAAGAAPPASAELAERDGAERDGAERDGAERDGAERDSESAAEGGWSRTEGASPSPSPSVEAVIPALFPKSLESSPAASAPTGGTFPAAESGAAKIKPIALDPIVAPIPQRKTDPMGELLDRARIEQALRAQGWRPPDDEATHEEAVALAKISQRNDALRDLEAETPTMRLPVGAAPPWPADDAVEQTKNEPPIGSVPPPANLISRRPLGPPIPREEPDFDAPTPARPQASEPLVIETSSVTDDELEELLALADRTGSPPRTRDGERLEVYSPRPPPRPQSRAPEEGLPKVIVAIEPEYVAQVSSLLSGGPAAESAALELRRQGVAALPAIMERFPGPTRVSRMSPIEGVPAPSEAGPLLSLIVALGRLALRDVLARVGDPSPETRFWATWLLTELVDPVSADALLPRLVDDDLGVRRAGWAAARALLERPGVDPDDVRERLVDPLVGVVLDPGGGTALRIRAATALGELRDRRAAEGLVLGLEAREPELREACHQALITVTRHDPTRSGESWSSWYSNHGERSRVEWLIEALLDDDPAFREAAAHELKERTKVFFGYYADLPRVERERAYERYRTWYREEGRIRFGA